METDDIETSELDTPIKKRQSGIPTGNAGEYLVMGELLRRGFDAQLADRNTRAYDILACPPGRTVFRKVQVKTVRSPPWYVTHAAFLGDLLDQVIVYVLLGKEAAKKPVQFFITRNRDLAEHVHTPATFHNSGFMALKAVVEYEAHWKILCEP